MPGLLTLKTDLKSLKYGQDTPGGGDSGQPYIKTDINTVDSGFNRFRLTKFDDGLIRGGIVGATNASVVDTLRIGKFFTDFPKGPLFLVKQVGLQLSNPRVESSILPTNRPTRGQGFFTNAINFVSNVANRIENAVGPTRIYNLGINTLAQVPVNAIGGHIVRHGFLPNNDDSKYYFNVITKKNFQNNTNRLLDLTDKFSLGSIGIENKGINLREQGVLNRLTAALSSVDPFVASTILGVTTTILGNNNETEIDSYIGGPNSVYGIGSTVIRRSVNTSNPNRIGDFDFKEQSKIFAGKTRNANGESEPVNYNNALSKDSAGDASISNYDFPTGTDHVASAVDQTVVNYKFTPTSPSLKSYAALQKQIEQQQQLLNPNNLTSIPSGSTSIPVYVNQFGIYDTQRDDRNTINKNSNYNSVTDVKKIAYKNSYGEVITINKSKWSDVSRETRVGSFGKAKHNGKELRAADSINLTPIFSGSSYWYGDEAKGKVIRDLVKFTIQSVSTDSPNISDFMVFRAYITQFSDNVDAKWSDINYVGRGNPFHIYTGFNRKISIGFKVAALSAAEMQPMYSKLNNLMSSLMPDYGSGNVMRGPLHRMTVGNYLDAQLGILTSISYTIPNDSPWEIAIDEPEGGSKMLILPHIIEVSMNFTPIGAETGANVNGKKSVSNKIEAKSKDTSFLAQNTTGDDAPTIQYYDSFFNK